MSVGSSCDIRMKWPFRVLCSGSSGIGLDLNFHYIHVLSNFMTFYIIILYLTMEKIAVVELPLFSCRQNDSGR